MSLVDYIGSQFANPRGLGGALSTFFMNRLNRAQYRAAERLVASCPGGRVLDIGFGNGYLLERLLAYSTNTYYGVEISPDMLSAAQRRCQAALSSGRLTLKKGSAQALPFDNCFFELIYTVNTVYFWQAPEETLAEILRVLKPGGTFANVFYTKEWLGKLRYTRMGFAKYTPEELLALTQSAGFSARLEAVKPGCAYCLVAERQSG